MATDIDTRTRESSGAGVDTLLERIAERLGATVKASTIFGEPVERDGLTIIPVAKARWGFGGGGGSGQDTHGPGSGGGGGGGMTIAPVGYIEIGHGQTAFRPIRDARSYLPYILGATALLMLSLGQIGRRWRPRRTIRAGFLR
jgi:uncharacterized spore protein YtfJ